MTDERFRQIARAEYMKSLMEKHSHISGSNLAEIKTKLLDAVGIIDELSDGKRNVIYWNALRGTAKDLKLLSKQFSDRVEGMNREVLVVQKDERFIRAYRGGLPPADG